MCIKKGNGVFCCGMYEEHCLPTTCDNVVSIPVLRMVCFSAPSPELHKPEYPYCFSCGTTDCLQTNCGGVVV